jgi:beta-N-acetylhexosaminidase
MMRHKKLISSLGIGFCLLISACGSTTHTTQPIAISSARPDITPAAAPTMTPTAAPTKAPTPTPSPVAAPDPIQDQIRQMTIDEKIGQMLLIGVDGVAVSEQTRDLIERYHVGGIILYKENIQDTAQTTAYLNELKSINAAKNKVPLWLSVDQEGGRVSRMPDEFAKLPTNRTIGEQNKAGFSNKLGMIIGKELQAVGFNMDFAPVLDINSNPKNPIIGDRSYGADAGLVSRLGVQTMLGIQSQRIAAVVKHFPGHGDTTVDSHLDLPVVNTSLNRLRTFEWLPFQNAIKHQADAIMVAHILLPRIDPDHPASFSKIVITDYLRKELHYNGVVMTDDMTMGGIMNHYDLQDVAVQSVNAGSDVIMVAHDYNKALAVLKNLKSNIESGTISMSRVDQSVERILRLKQKYALRDKSIHSPDVTPINNQIKSVLAQYMN